MAVAGSGVYAKGSLFGCDEAWYHGDLTRVEAEQALRASGCDCFLIRQRRGALVLSLIHQGQAHHVNIKRGPGWYELESGSSAQYSFPELEELVSHYSSEPIAISEDLKLTLGVACEKTEPHFYETIPQVEPLLEADHHYETIKGIYSKGKPADLTKYNWFRGSISEEQAHTALEHYGNTNTFLVRHSTHNLILSMRKRGWRSHDVIHHSPEGYHLEGKERVFKTVPEMIAHYQHFPIEGDQVLGRAIDQKISGPQLQTKKTSTPNFKQSADLLRVSWKRCADLPLAVSTSPVVKIGDNVYVGSGLRQTGAESIIFKYNLTLDTWTRLPQCPTNQHALATLNEELISIGGQVLGRATNILYTFRDDMWQEVLPPMPTPRFLLSAISHQNRLIITAGGTLDLQSNGEFTQTDLVEVYISDDKKWYSKKCLPFPIAQFSITIINNTCYTLGGVSTFTEISTTLHITVSSLLENATPADSGCATPQAWNRLPDKHPLTFPSLVGLDGRLVTMGGSVDQRLRHGTKYITTYDSATETWVECKGAELPLPLYRPNLVKLENNQVLLIGGQARSQHFSSAVFLAAHHKARYV